MDGQSLQGLINTLNQILLAINAQTQQLKTTFPNFVTAPATAASAGTPNQVAFDATHFYVCIATNTWVRCALASW